MANSVSIRLAREEDVDAILSILREVASHVPINLRTPDRVAAMRCKIENLCDSGLSYIAVDRSEVPIGFQLAKNASWLEECYVHLVYAGVTSDFAGKGTFRRLIEVEQKVGKPLVTEVHPKNKSSMADKLTRLGGLVY
jgi:hypothetical protein